MVKKYNYEELKIRFRSSIEMNKALHKLLKNLDSKDPLRQRILGDIETSNDLMKEVIKNLNDEELVLLKLRYK